MQPLTKSKTTTFFFLFSFQAFAAAIWTFLQKSDPGKAYFWGLSLEGLALFLFLILLGLFFAGMGFFVFRRDQLYQKINSVLNNPWLQRSVILTCLSISLFAIYKQYSWDVIQKLMPVGICFWMMGWELMLISPAACPNDSWLITAKKWGIPDWVYALISTAGILLACFLPSNVPASINGLPWNSHPEFILIAALLPFALLINWRPFSKLWVFIPVLLVLLIKVCLAIFAPAYGINILAFQNLQNLEKGVFVTSYETLLNNQVTTVMREPYNHLREFPIEYVNHDQRTSPVNIWIGLDLTAYGSLAQGEKLFFLQHNLISSTVNLTDMDSGKKYPLLLADDTKSLDYQTFQNTPSPTKFILNGNFIFQGDEIYHLRPVLLKPDGSLEDPFTAGVFWRTADGAATNRSLLNLYSSLSLFVDVFLFLIVISALIWGIITLYFSGAISSLDLFLGASALLAYPFSAFVDRPDTGSFIHWTIAFFILMKTIHNLVTRQNKWSSKSFVLIILPILLLVFLKYDYDYLRQIEVFPKGEDSQDYQSYSNMIYLNGDFWLQNIPPRAYKLLFPYLVGFIHIFFGQSSAALFFLNAWCAGLTGKKMLDILNKFNLPVLYANVAAFLFYFVLTGPLFYLFYFRFGIIEPPAVFCLLWTLDLGLQGRNAAMFILGVITTLFRLDYLGAAFGSCLLTAQPFQGSMTASFRSFFDFVKSAWQKMGAYAFSLIVIPVSMISYYFLTQNNYMLNASDTIYHSLGEVLLGLLKLASGGSDIEFKRWIPAYPFDTGFMIAVFYLGVIFAVISVFFRWHRFKTIDMRLGLVILAYFAVYIFVRPTNYAPRFSTPLLPMAVISIVYSLHQLLSKRA